MGQCDCGVESIIDHVFQSEVIPMPRLKLTFRQEKFAQHIVEGKHLMAAYTAAGYEGNSEVARNLLNKKQIKQRIQELQERQVQRHDVTVDSLILELESARKSARKWHQSGTMVQATLAKAKLLGLLETKLRVEGTLVANAELTGLADDELVILQDLAQKLIRKSSPQAVLDPRRN